ncbi:MAG: hypothetical protein ACYCVH_14580 [Ignavibacteriaceae bacterium]
MVLNLSFTVDHFHFVQNTEKQEIAKNNGALETAPCEICWVSLNYNSESAWTFKKESFSLPYIISITIDDEEQISGAVIPPLNPRAPPLV